MPNSIAIPVSMRRKLPNYRAVLGYTLLILLAMAQQGIAYAYLYTHAAAGPAVPLFVAAGLLTLLLGFALPGGAAVVLTFTGLVAYFVWLVTYAPANLLTWSWLLLYPANTAAAVFLKRNIIRTRQLADRIGTLQSINPDVDFDTALGSDSALASTLVKQSNLARRYPDRYGFCILLFKIDFLPLVREALGAPGYSRLLLELSETIQRQIRFEDYKFGIGSGRFVVICPLARPDDVDAMKERIKNAMMDTEILNMDGRPLKFVIRAGALVFQAEQFDKYADVNAVLAALERNAETDLIGEYI
ncbi:diguanylate cyclase [Saccharibacillus sp. CPCC 101409]|uniref:diguanylate cyclase domain-containing protein n=1 Tax=Saccharibacillus sp. CPCC 101409 TaxID=3058041 RepID=UPI002673487A|nr:diguanylate cyclase [Saccharibacillus sp. CPCC 101409]MDO3409946.1 diguanylate cyclase [Saccharibacillus sp. CPCC 101409]